MSYAGRREFLVASGALLVAPLARAQQAASQFRIGLLIVNDEAVAKANAQALAAGLRDRGYIENSVIIDLRYAAGDRSRLPALVDELIALKPDVLAGTEITATAMKAKTSTIPIVLLFSADPVAAGLVKSLARPGTNVTGMAGLLYTLVAKQVELLTELVPKMSRFALLTEPIATAKEDRYFGRPGPWELAARSAAKEKGLGLVVLRARDSAGLQEAFATFKKERPEALLMATNGVVINIQREVIEEARRRRLPVISGYARFVESGGLISYGANFAETYRYAAKFVDRILKGAKPDDLPVEQVSKYELVVNQKTAREMHLKLPQTILFRADRVIE